MGSQHKSKNKEERLWLYWNCQHLKKLTKMDEMNDWILCNKMEYTLEQKEKSKKLDNKSSKDSNVETNKKEANNEKDKEEEIKTNDTRMKPKILSMNGIVNVLICCLLAIGIAILSMIELFEKCQCAMMHSLIQKDVKLKSLNILWIICCCNIHLIMMIDQRVILFLKLFQKKKMTKRRDL